MVHLCQFLVAKPPVLFSITVSILLVVNVVALFPLQNIWIFPQLVRRASSFFNYLLSHVLLFVFLGAEAMDTMNSLPMLRFFPPGLLTVVSSYLHSGGWIPIASPPTVRSYHSAVVVEDKILLLGGRSPYYREEHGVEEYCPRTNQWRTLSWKLPQPRICMAVHYSAATQHLILMGDLTLTRAVMDTRCVARNMVTGVWSEIFTLPLAVGSCSLVALHNNNVNLFLAALFP